MHISLNEAQTHLLQAIERALAGEEVVIEQANMPLVKLTPVATLKKPRVLGIWEGQVWMTEDFNATPDDFAEYA
jgi:antitoxin (DNA-binding transcriptional repressor) of toxin-antitoxin stability system